MKRTLLFALTALALCAGHAGTKSVEKSGFKFKYGSKEISFYKSVFDMNSNRYFSGRIENEQEGCRPPAGGIIVMGHGYEIEKVKSCTIINDLRCKEQLS